MHICEGTLSGSTSGMLVLGGGYIGLELGQAYAALGTRVSVAEMKPTILPGVDPQLVAPLAKRVQTQFEELLLAGAEVHAHQALVAADAVALVHDRVADLGLGQVLQPVVEARLARRFAAGAPRRAGV